MSPCESGAVLALSLNDSPHRGGMPLRPSFGWNSFDAQHLADGRERLPLSTERQDEFYDLTLCIIRDQLSVLRPGTERRSTVSEPALLGLALAAKAEVSEQSRLARIAQQRQALV